MVERAFEFAAPAWLWLLLVPALVWVWLRLTASFDDNRSYRDYADPALLPVLLGRQEKTGGREGWRRFLPWLVAWTAIVVAMASPRWGFEDRQLFRSGVDLVILLDLSDSMNATDVAPSRIARARQEISDLIDENKEARIGLIAFASLAHVVTPLTEDAAALKRELPALSTTLVRLKGSRPSQALLRAQQMLDALGRNTSRHVLIVSDGEFADESDIATVRQLAADGIHVHALGIGTTLGGAIMDGRDRPVRAANGDVVISHLDTSGLEKVAEIGNGVYQTAVFRNTDTRAILAAVDQDAEALKLKGQTARVWNERFYWPLLLALLVLLPLFRVQRRLIPGGGDST